MMKTAIYQSHCICEVEMQIKIYFSLNISSNSGPVTNTLNFEQIKINDLQKTRLSGLTNLQQKHSLRETALGFKLLS